MGVLGVHHRSTRSCTKLHCHKRALYFKSIFFFFFTVAHMVHDNNQNRKDSGVHPRMSTLIQPCFSKKGTLFVSVSLVDAGVAK